jgi:DNA-binding GntR family transcriptional regulator
VSALPEVDRTTAGQDVIAWLREAIIRGEIPAGSQLREVSIARELGVGRAPVREALRQLMQEGLITHEAHRGSVVIVLTEDDLVDIYAAREAIEPHAVRLITERARGVEPLDLTRLDEALARLRGARSGPKPTKEVADADLALHEAIVAASASPRLYRMFRTLSAEMRMYLLQAHPPYDPGTYIEDHELLVQAIVEGSPKAPELMRQHLIHSRAVILDDMAVGRD